jgi:hypothetical protein
LVEHGDIDILLFYMAAIPLLYMRTYLESVVQYCIKYSKKDILDKVLAKYDTEDKAPGRSFTIQECITQWMSKFSYQYNNMQYLDLSHMDDLAALSGACTGNHHKLVSEILAKETLDEFDVQDCGYRTKSINIIKLLHPKGYISNSFFVYAVKTEMYEVADWVIDNNMELLFNTIETNSKHDYLHSACRMGIKPLLYLIRDKKIKIKQNDIVICGRNSNVTLLLLIHFSDCDYAQRGTIDEDYFEQFLSMYPKCDKTKFKFILCNDIYGDKYIEQYFIKRNMLHNEMKLLYDLPDDLCKQIM